MASTGGARERYASLDGLRGIAAVVVVLCHVGLTNSALYGQAEGSPFWVWLLTRTPLHLLWAGGESVMVFFVLSGFVLALPFLRGGHAWGSYYRKRLVRLYLPVWGSLAFALLLFALLGRTPVEGNPFLTAEAAGVTARSLAGDVTLANVSQLNSVLWSLKWEVAFSLLLPLYVAAVGVLRRLGPAAFVVPLAAVMAGSALGVEWLTYLPMFLVGCLLAAHRETLARGQGAWTAGGALLLLSVPILPIGSGTPFGTAAIVAGAALAVAAFIGWRPARNLGERRAVQWVGLRSFSLYLVHLPVVLACASLLPTAPASVLLLIAGPVSLLAAAGFYRLVELPSAALAVRLASASLPRITKVASELPG